MQTKIASDAFQEILDTVLRLLKGVYGIADDILTHGNTEIQHNGSLLNLLETARMNNLSIMTKCSSSLQTASSLGKD